MAPTTFPLFIVARNILFHGVFSMYLYQIKPYLVHASHTIYLITPANPTNASFHNSHDQVTLREMEPLSIEPSQQAEEVVLVALRGATIRKFCLLEDAHNL